MGEVGECFIVKLNVFGKTEFRSDNNIGVVLVKR